MRLRPEVNTIILFSTKSDIKFAMADSVPSHIPTPEQDQQPTPTQLEWLKPSQQDCISFNPRTDIPASQSQSQSRYLLVTPGENMLKSLIDKRVQVRSGGGDGDRFRSLDVPSMELIEYAQGLLLTGYMGEVLMYVIEWEWK